MTAAPAATAIHADLPATEASGTAKGDTKLGFAAFDADNHYYEATDAFIRHVDPRMHRRCMQWATVGGRERLLVAGKINRFIPNPTFDPVARPGCLDDYFRGKIAASNMREAFGRLEPISAAYRDRDARVELLDAQGLQACFLFPTLGVGMEAALEHDVDALTAAFGGFNRWLADDWGFAYRERIFAAGYLTLADPDWALDELDWLIANDVRVVNLRPSSVPDGAGGRRSLGHPAHDKVWQRLDDHGITVAMHSGDSGYGFVLEALGGRQRVRVVPPRPAQEPDHLLADLRRAGLAAGRGGAEPAPQHQGRHHRNRIGVGVALRQEARQDLPAAAARLRRGSVGGVPATGVGLALLRGRPDRAARPDRSGPRAVRVGLPHAEGLADPVSFVHDLEGFSGDEIKLVMSANGLGLTQRAAAAA